jgi:hypothetical protein
MGLWQSRATRREIRFTAVTLGLTKIFFKNIEEHRHQCRQTAFPCSATFAIRRGVPSSHPPLGVHGGIAMGLFPSLVPLLALLTTGLGLWGIAGFIWSKCPVWSCRFQRVFLAMFLLAAGGCLLAAVTWERGVLPCGLAVAALFLAMLWPHSGQSVQHTK